MVDGRDDRLDLAPATFAHDGLEHVPDIGVGLEVLLAVAQLVHAFDQTPIDQRPEVHAGVAAGDLELVHDVVGAERLAGDEEQGVDFRHRAVDPPVPAHFAPASDQQVFGLLEGAGHRYSAPKFQNDLKDLYPMRLELASGRLILSGRRPY